jgi:hypothetical protein
MRRDALCGYANAEPHSQPRAERRKQQHHTMPITKMTTESLSPGPTSGLIPEFGRIQVVEQLYGLKRGTTYNLLAAGKIRGCVLRVKGRKSGVRLISLESVRSYILSQMEQQNASEAPVHCDSGARLKTSASCLSQFAGQSNGSDTTQEAAI